MAHQEVGNTSMDENNQNSFPLESVRFRYRYMHIIGVGNIPRAYQGGNRLIEYFGLSGEWQGIYGMCQNITFTNNVYELIKNT